MKYIVLILLIISIVTASKIRTVDPDNTIDEEYIVVFREDARYVEIDAHMKIVKHWGKVMDTYSIGKFQGYSAKISKNILPLIEKSEIVDYIEKNTRVSAFQSCSTQNNAVWGLDRISEREINLDGIFHFEGNAGKGVDAYIVDTGILITHVDFEGRAQFGANFIDDEEDTDCNGHGTHVAGTVGGAQFGVAKKTTLFAVKVLGCSGSGSNAGVISGINWVAGNAKRRNNPSVANMSLGGPKSSAVNAAVAGVVSQGTTFVVAAGNSNDDACYYSPSSSPSAISVGATLIASNGPTQQDDRSWFSNYGECVTIFAPGSMIESDWITTNSSVKTISGTSMASPHVAGAAALYLGAFSSATPAEVKSWMTSQANSQMIDLQCSSAEDPTSCSLSPNNLLFAPC